MGFAKPSLKARALRLLARREHSRSELTAKLAPHAEGEDLAALLDALQARDFINEERVAQSVLHRRAPRLGAQRVLQELRRKGLDEDLVRATARQLQDTELERARAVWRQRFGDAPAATTPQERVRQMRFLAARGFAADVVRRVIQASDDE
ncbi:MAG: recombination regulator RecX [Proteobacteria bacterium]|nr:recombination regulator RecX [Pseudomonadota bacterium]MBS0493314.1 recombination regulator RecX [Pseudomonadota bacterium]